jgi:hypothetical protein
LTTKDQGVIFERTIETTAPSRRTTTTDPGSYSWKLLLIKDARVHYVVLKQQPRTTHPTHQPLPKGKATMHDRCSQETRNTSPTPQPRTPPEGRTRKPRHGPVVSGPNSVPNTKPRAPSPAPFQDPLESASVLGKKKTTRPLFVDIPPVSTRRRTIVCATGVTPDNPATRT